MHPGEPNYFREMVEVGMYLRQNRSKKFLVDFQYFSEGVVCLNQMTIEPTIRRLHLRLHPKHQLMS